MTRTEIYDMEVALYGAEFPRNTYNLQLRGYTLVDTDTERMFTSNFGNLEEYLNGDDVVFNVIPTGALDGANRQFNVPDLFIAGTMVVFVNGNLQLNGTHFTEDVTLDGFVMGYIIDAGDNNIVCSYIKQKAT